MAARRGIQRKGIRAPWGTGAAMAVVVACTPPDATPGDDAPLLPSTDPAGDDTGPVWEGPAELVLSFAVLADPHVTAEGAHADRLRQAVDWLAEEAEPRDLSFAVIVGDIAWNDGLALTHDLLDELPIPWVPVLGDNPIQSGDEAAFDATFGGHLDALGDDLSGYRRQPTPVTTAQGSTHHWQQVAWTAAGIRFLGLDWNTRTVAPVLGEMADLHDVEGGAWRWLTEELGGLEDGPPGRVVMLSHHPMVMSPGAFDEAEWATLQGVLEPHRQALGVAWAGHWHTDVDLAAADNDGLAVRVVDATWDDTLSFRVVDVWRGPEGFTYEDTRISL